MKMSAVHRLNGDRSVSSIVIELTYGSRYSRFPLERVYALLNRAYNDSVIGNDYTLGLKVDFKPTLWYQSNFLLISDGSILIRSKFAQKCKLVMLKMCNYAF
jgi:hypothetical protein